MTTDLYANTLIADGQQIDTAFLNNGTRFNRAMLTDQILEKLIPFIPVVTGTNPSKQSDLTGQGGANASTLYAYTVHPGSGYLIQGASNAVINISAGTLLQKIASADGADSTLVPCAFDGTTSAFPAIANGATNYRIDLLQMALSYTTDTLVTQDFEDDVTRALTTVANTPTRRRIQFALTVKQGAPAASPVVPEPDAGAVPVGFVCVGASWTSATAPVFGLESVASPTTQAVVYDLRMPLGVRLERVDPVLFKLETNWALSNQNQTLTASSTTNKMYASAQSGPGRLIGAMIEGTSAVFPSSFGQMRVGATTPSANYTPGNIELGGSTAPNGLIRIYRADLERGHTPMGTGPTIQPSVTNFYGPPLWANGWRVPQDPTISGTVNWCTVGAAWVNTAIATLGGIWFIFATGL